MSQLHRLVQIKRMSPLFQSVTSHKEQLQRTQCALEHSVQPSHMSAGFTAVLHNKLTNGTQGGTYDYFLN